MSTSLCPVARECDITFDLSWANLRAVCTKCDERMREIDLEPGLRRSIRMNYCLFLFGCAVLHWCWCCCLACMSRTIDIGCDLLDRFITDLLGPPEGETKLFYLNLPIYTLTTVLYF